MVAIGNISTSNVNSCPKWAFDPVGLKSYNILAPIPQDQNPDEQLRHNITTKWQNHKIQYSKWEKKRDSTLEEL